MDEWRHVDPTNLPATARNQRHPEVMKTRIAAGLAAGMLLLGTTAACGDESGEAEGGATHETSEKPKKADDDKAKEAEASAKSESDPESDPGADKATAESTYFVTLEDQTGKGFYPGLSREDLIDLGYEACDELERLPDLNDTSVMPSAGDFARENDMNIDQALGIYSAAAVALCPDAGE